MAARSAACCEPQAVDDREYANRATTPAAVRGDARSGSGGFASSTRSRNSAKRRIVCRRRRVVVPAAVDFVELLHPAREPRRTACGASSIGTTSSCRAVALEQRARVLLDAAASSCSGSTSPAAPAARDTATRPHRSSARTCFPAPAPGHLARPPSPRPRRRRSSGP